MRRREGNSDSTEGRAEWLPWLTGVLTDQGYDLSSERSGGKARLSRDTGLSQGIITRLLSGQAVSYETLLTLARGTGISVRELLIRTGKATEDDFPQLGTETGQIGVSSGKPLTPEELAELAGVDDADKAWFVTMLRRMRRSGDNGDSTAGGAAAEG